jgi:peroxiredoxin
MIIKFTKLLLIVFLLFLSEVNSQERITFPHNVILKDKNNINITSKIFFNFKNPLIIDYWATYCKPCIQQLDGLKDIYKEWQQKYGVQIIVISIDKKSDRKKALKIIKKHNWPFQFYFDHKKELLKQLSPINFVPQSFIFDGKFNKVKSYKGAKFKMLPGQKLDVRNFKPDLSNYVKVLDSLTRVN